MPKIPSVKSLPSYTFEWSLNEEFNSVLRYQSIQAFTHIILMWVSEGEEQPRNYISYDGFLALKKVLNLCDKYFYIYIYTHDFTTTI